MSSQQGVGKLLIFLWGQIRDLSCGFHFLSFHRPYLGETWSQPPFCEWKQISALSLHSPRSRKIQYLAYLRDQNLALWGRWRGRGTRRGRGPGAAACWPTGTPAPGCGMGCHARSGLWTARNTRRTCYSSSCEQKQWRLASSIPSLAEVKEQYFSPLHVRFRYACPFALKIMKGEHFFFKFTFDKTDWE